jgi:probable HAF family extracellular repeat protein
LVVSSLAFVFGPPALQARAESTKYTYKTIPTLPGGTYATPGGINNSGLVVGYGDVADGSTHGFVYDVRRGTSRDIGEGFPTAINDLGEAVGESASGETALFWGGKVIPLGSVPGEIESFATSVNNEGVAVGTALLPGRTIALVLYVYGQAIPIDLGNDVKLYAPINPTINDEGIIAGTVSVVSTGHFRAFRHDIRSGKTTLLEPIAGDTDTWGLGIHARGEILGYSFVVFSTTEHIGTWDRRGNFTVHFTEGTAQYPTVSNNLVFNDRDQIVISSTTDQKSYIVPTVGQRHDLDTLVINLPAINQPLFDVVGINDDGVIAGWNFETGFVLVPLHGDHEEGH